MQLNTNRPTNAHFFWYLIFHSKLNARITRLVTLYISNVLTTFKTIK